jgi:hypothetical protein
VPTLDDDGFSDEEEEDDELILSLLDEDETLEDDETSEELLLPEEELSSPLPSLEELDSVFEDDEDALTLDELLCTFTLEEELSVSVPELLGFSLSLLETPGSLSPPVGLSLLQAKKVNAMANARVAVRGILENFAFMTFLLLLFHHNAQCLVVYFDYVHSFCLDIYN